MDVCLYSSIIVAEGLQGRFDVSNPNPDPNYEYIEQSVRTIYSFAVIVMWIRFLYYFRIFRQTGYYIRMLVQVVIDIRYFIFIFVLTIFAFAHAFFVLQKNSSQVDPNFLNVSSSIAYVYLLSMAQLNTSVFGDYHPGISWLFLVLANFLLQIVLLNLLISIVADTFSNICSNYNVIMYKDMLDMIIENRFLAVGPLTQELNHKHLFMVLPVSTASAASEGPPKPASLLRSDNSKAMMNMLENLEATMKEQHLK